MSEVAVIQLGMCTTYCHIFVTHVIIMRLFFFWLHPTACRILVSQPGMEPRALAVRMPSPNHRNIREYTPCVFRRNYLDVGGNAKDKPLRKIPLI